MYAHPEFVDASALFFTMFHHSDTPLHQKKLYKSKLRVIALGATNIQKALANRSIAPRRSLQIPENPRTLSQDSIKSKQGWPQQHQ